MACPNCDHTMTSMPSAQGITRYWCPRCGTLRETMRGGEIRDSTPVLVSQCREFRTAAYRDLIAPPSLIEMWRMLGIEESIETPERRRS